MTSLFTVRRRAEEFAIAIDGGSVDGSLDAGTHAADLSEFIGIVSMLREHETAPRTEFVDNLRNLLLVEAQTALAPQPADPLLPRRQHGARERRLVAAASAAVLIGGTTTMAAAAQSALPGEALYPIKRSIEHIDAGLSMSDAGKGRDLLSQAETRLTEVRGLLASDSIQSAPEVPATLTTFSAQADEGSALLLGSFEQTGDPTSASAVRSFATGAIATLESFADAVPVDAQDELSFASSTLREIDERATLLCRTCLPDVSAVQAAGVLAARVAVNRPLQTMVFRRINDGQTFVVRKEAVDVGPASVSAKPKITGPSGSRPEAPITGPTAGPIQAPVPTQAPLPTAPEESRAPGTPSLQSLDDPVSGNDPGAGKPSAVQPVVVKPPAPPKPQVAPAVPKPPAPSEPPATPTVPEPSAPTAPSVPSKPPGTPAVPKPPATPTVPEPSAPSAPSVPPAPAEALVPEPEADQPLP